MLKIFLLIMILSTPVMAKNKIVVPIIVTVYNGTNIATSSNDRNTQTQIVNGVKAY